MIVIHKDVELIKEIFDYDVILIGIGLGNYMNRGFQYDIAINFPLVKKTVDEDFQYCDQRWYGTVYTVKEYGREFCLCYVHDGGFSKRMRGTNVYIRYDCLEQCIRSVNEHYKGKDVKIASNIIGWSKYEGDGDKDRILKIFEDCATDITIHVYDYEQKNFNSEIFHEFCVLKKKIREKEITLKEYTALRRELKWRSKHGIFVPMPEEYEYDPKKNRFKDVINVRKPKKIQKKGVSLQSTKSKKKKAK